MRKCQFHGLMVVTDFNIERVATRPTEADAPLVIDPDRILSGTITVQPFEAVAGWNTKVCESRGTIQQRQFVQGPLLDRPGYPTRTFFVPDSLRFPVGEAPYHRAKVT